MYKGIYIKELARTIMEAIKSETREEPMYSSSPKAAEFPLLREVILLFYSSLPLIE